MEVHYACTFGTPPVYLSQLHGQDDLLRMLRVLQAVPLDVAPEGLQDAGLGPVLQAQHLGQAWVEREALGLVVQGDAHAGLARLAADALDLQLVPEGPDVLGLGRAYQREEGNGHMSIRHACKHRACTHRGEKQARMWDEGCWPQPV